VLAGLVCPRDPLDFRHTEQNQKSDDMKQDAHVGGNGFCGAHEVKVSGGPLVIVFRAQRTV